VNFIVWEKMVYFFPFSFFNFKLLCEVHAAWRRPSFTYALLMLDCKTSRSFPSNLLEATYHFVSSLS
jgi:hypothetical protein